MNSRTLATTLAVLCALAALFGCAKQERREKLEVRMDRWVVLGEEVRISFTMPMVDGNALAAAPLPDITINPPAAGVFTWTSPQELTFIPEKNALQYGASYEVTARNLVPLKGPEYKIDSLIIGEFIPRYFEMAGKVASWPVSRGNPGLLDFLGWHSGEIGQGALLLLYDQPVDPSKVGGLVTVTHYNRKLSAESATPTSSQLSFFPSSNASHIVSVKIKNLPPSGEAIRVKAPRWTDTGAVEYKTWDFTVNSVFTCDWNDQSDWKYTNTPREASYGYEGEYYEGEDGARGEARPYGFRKSFRLSFNHPVSYEDLLRALNVEAAEDSSVDFWINGYGYESYQLTVQSGPGQKFQLRLTDLSDYLGNPLEKPINLSLTTPDLPPELYLPRSPLVVESKGNTLPVKFLNIQQLKMTYQTIASPADYIRLLNRKLATIQLENAKSKTIRFNTKEYPLNTYHQIDIPLEASSPFQMIMIEAAETGSQGRSVRSHRLLVHSSDVAITSKVSEQGVFVWVTAIADPVPLRSAAVTLFNASGSPLAQGSTDSSGTVFLAAPGLLSGDTLRQSLYLSAEFTRTAGFSQLVESELASAWQFRLPKKSARERFRAVIFSDRGVYRSGDTVHLKVIADKAAADVNRVNITINDSRGREVQNGDYPLDDFYATACDFTVRANAPVGEYSVHVTQGESRTSYTFQVEEYRAPNFTVNVSALRDEWENDERNYARIKAEYTKGGVLKGRDVTWRVYRRSIPFTVRQLPGYVFGLESGDQFDGNVADGEGRLNDAGEIALDFSVSSPVTDSLMLYILQGTVTDTDRQTYSGAYSSLIHPAGYYVGVKPPSREVISSGDDVIVPVVVVDRNGDPVENAKVTASLEQVEYHSDVRLVEFNMTQMDTREEYAKVREMEIATRRVPVQCRFNIPEAGYYRMVFSVKDPSGRIMRTGFKVTVSGDRPTAWPRFDKEQIELLCDKDRYRDRETARLVTMSPYKKALGLLTVEKDGEIVYKKTFTVNDNTPAIQFPITAAYAPNVYASVILVRGREHRQKDASGFETGAPGFKIGYAKIDVDPADRRLTLLVKPAGRNFHPGESVSVDLECKDREKRPVAGQVCLAVVDEAVLSLTGYRTPDPLSQILSIAPLGIRTGSNLLDLPHSRRSRHETLFEGGGDDFSGLVEPEKILRNLFMSTAYWNPAVLLDGNGRGRVTFKLPDNITGYRVMAVVTDTDQRMGSAQDRITSKKPLMIMPVLPRFVYEGDSFTAEARVFNETGTSGQVAVTATLQGARFTSGNGRGSSAVKNNDQAFFSFPIKVTDPSRLSIRFSAALGRQSDRAEYVVPVLKPVTDRKVVRSLNVAAGGSGEVSFDVPADRLPGSLSLDVTVSSTVLSELKDAVGFVMQYPHGCIEQTTSNAYPLIIFKDIIKEIGVEVDREQLKKYAEAGIERILTFVNSSGGLSYWPGNSDSHPYGTGFGAMALVEAKKQGFVVPQDVLNKIGGYLESVLSRSAIRQSEERYSDASADTLALYAAVLGRMGRPQAGAVNALWRNNDKLSSFGLAFLAVAVKEMNGSGRLLGDIISALKKRIVEHDDEAYVTDRSDYGGFSMGSNIRSHGAVLYALSAVGGDDRLLVKLLNGLLKRRRSNGFWGNTQSTIFGIMGIHRYAVTGGSYEPAFDFTVNGKSFPSAGFQKLSSRTYSLNLEEASLAGGARVSCRLRNRGSRPVFASSRLLYNIKLEKGALEPTSNGFTLERSYETAEGRSLSADSLPLGELVLVRLKVKADAKCYYCAVDDRLPAGFEPLNTNLKTTERVGTARLSAAALKTMDKVSYSEIRDSRVFFYVNEMDAGEYEFTYFARTTTAGTCLAPAARVEPMYDPDKSGTSRVEFVTIRK